MNIRTNLIRTGAALAAVLALTPSALALGGRVGDLAGPAAQTAVRRIPAASLTTAAQQTEADWRLLLVNPWNALPEDYEVELATLSNGLQVDARIYDDLNDMLTDCRAAGLEPIVCSAYRTQATQTRLYNNKVARVRASGVPEDQVEAEAARWVAKPGTSEHQTGLALDIVAASYQILDEKQEDTAEQQWLMENSWKYGFILRYPSEKSDVTGIGYEPWHYRSGGTAAAAESPPTGGCLEAYLGEAALPAAELTPAQPVRPAEVVRPLEPVPPETADI